MYALDMSAFITDKLVDDISFTCRLFNEMSLAHFIPLYVLVNNPPTPLLSCISYIYLVWIELLISKLYNGFEFC
jgi:hypothetical protein